MEKIGDGISIEDIIYDNSGELLKKLPTNFNFNKFFEILRQEVAKMHNERKYHRDLHAGNVLIDENGEPVIIDFGDSKDLILSDDDPYREVNKRVEEIVYPNDDDNVNKLRANFGRYLAKFNFFK